MQLSLPRVPYAAPLLENVGRCLWTRVRVPDDLTSVTRIDREAEVDPRAAGMTVAGRDQIWAAVEHLFRGGLHPAITMEVRRRGKIVLKRSIGCVHGNLPGDRQAPEVLNPDSPISLFSASKSVSSLLIHKLVDDGQLSLDDRVVEYIPEFAPHGKDRVTIRELLAHRAGIPDVPEVRPEPELLRRWDDIVAMLCAAKPFDPSFQAQAYHALTGGFVIGEIVRRVSGRELPEVLHDWIAKPLKLRYMTYGLAPELRHLAPINAQTGPIPYWPATKFIQRVIGVPMQMAVNGSNDDAFLSSVVPAGNIYASADDACRVFQMLLNGGELDGVRVLKPQTVAAAIRPFGPLQIDRKLMLPMRYSPGFMRGMNPVGLFGPGSEAAFGHLGFLSVLCWADPSRDIAVSLLNTGKTLSPTAFTRLFGVLFALAKACPRVT